MWVDCMEYYQKNIGDYRNEIYTTTVLANMKPNIKCHGVDYRCDKRVYQVNCNFVAIPISMNKESLYKKAERNYFKK